MELIFRKQMPISGAVLKIIIGIVSIVFIIGVFLILDGLKEIKRVKQNNLLNRDVLKISQSYNYVEVIDFYGNHLQIFLSNIKYIITSNKDALNYLIYVEDNIEKSICLGYIENNKVRYFNSLLK